MSLKVAEPEMNLALSGSTVIYTTHSLQLRGRVQRPKPGAQTGTENQWPPGVTAKSHPATENTNTQGPMDNGLCACQSPHKPPSDPTFKHHFCI